METTMTQEANSISISEHGRMRMRQRGVRSQILDVVLSHADVALHAGGDCETFRLSRNGAAELVAAQVVNADVADRACRISVLVGRHGVVSVIRPRDGRRGRGYRRQMNTRATTNCRG